MAVDTPESEVAVRRALHQGLGSLQLDVRVEPLHQREVALAGKAGAQIAQAEGSVHLGVTTADDVEGQPLGGLLKHLDLERVVLPPTVERAGERFQRVAPQRYGQVPTAPPGEFRDHFPKDRDRPFLAYLPGEGSYQRADDPGLDLTLLEQGNTRLLIRRHVPSRVCYTMGASSRAAAAFRNSQTNPERRKGMNGHGLTSLRVVGWCFAAGATAWVWRASAEKSAERPLPDGVAVVRDVTYREDEGIRRTLDLYLPVESGTKLRPAIVAIHGGSWVGGSKREYGPQFARFAQHGFVVATVDYQLARPGAPSWVGALDDVAVAVDWLTDHAGTYQIDPRRIAAIGTSAGGLLAAHLARDDFRSRDSSRSNRRIRAAVCLSTPSSLATLAADRGLKHDPVRDLIGDRPEGFADREADASPISHVAPGWRPILLIHGTDDMWVSVNQAREMSRQCARLGVSHRLIEIAGARHGFELQVEAPNRRDLIPEIMDFLDQVD